MAPYNILIKLNIVRCVIKEVPIKPVYNLGEESKMKILKILFPISWLLIKGFLKRLYVRNFVTDFHPMFIFYNMAIVLLTFWLPYLSKVISALLHDTNLSFETLFAFSFLGVFGFQSLIFAMWIDMQDNDRLQK